MLLTLKFAVQNYDVFCSELQGVCKKDGKMRQFILKKACFDLLKQQNKACTVLLFLMGITYRVGTLW